MRYPFLDNKYSNIYFKIIQRAMGQTRRKTYGYQKHHILPKSLGGSDDKSNLVLLTYKEHRVCHCLLIKMVSSKSAAIKMRHAYGFFNKNSRFNGPRYKRGKNNVFSRPEIINMVRARMKANNPMKNPEIQAKRLASWRASRSTKECIPTRVLRDKFVTPKGIFKTKKAIVQTIGIPAWTVDTIYNNLDGYPISNGRRSRKIDHLQIDYNKSWRENGFDVIDRD